MRIAAAAAVLVLPASSLVLLAGPVAAATPTCAGVSATIVGSQIADRIVGTAGRDVIVTLGGDDQVDGRGGNDLICVGAGDDIVIGNSGNDRIYGGDGDDIIDGGAGADTISAGVGADVIKPGAGNDVVNAGFGGKPSEEEYFRPSDRTLRKRVTATARERGALFALTPSVADLADSGSDVIYGSLGYDTLKGKPSTTIVSYRYLPKPIQANLAKAVVFGNGGDKLYGIRQIEGTVYKDRIVGSNDPDLLIGGRGDDTIAGAGGSDFIDGGTGADTVTGDSGSDAVFAFGDHVRLGSGEDFALTLNSVVYGGSSSDEFILFGTSRVYGEDGSDWVFPWVDFDFDSEEIPGASINLATGLIKAGFTARAYSVENAGGDMGPDTIVGSDSANTLLGDEGDDTIDGGAGDDIIKGQWDNDTLTGGDGIDDVYGGTETDSCEGENVFECESTPAA